MKEFECITCFVSEFLCEFIFCLAARDVVIIVVRRNCCSWLNAIGQLFWSQRMVEAAAEWGEQGARLQGLYSEGGFKAQAHEQNILTYVDDQVRLLCLSSRTLITGLVVCLCALRSVCLQLEVAFTLMCVELKADVLALVARARVESLRIKVAACTMRTHIYLRADCTKLLVLSNDDIYVKYMQEAAMYDFQQTMKRIKSIVNDIDSHAGSDVAAMRTSSFVLSQAMQQERAFASTMAEASELFVSNVGMAARICVMREVSDAFRPRRGLEAAHVLPHHHHLIGWPKSFCMVVVAIIITTVFAACVGCRSKDATTRTEASRGCS